MKSNIFKKIAYSVIIAIIICTCTLVTFATSTSNLEAQKSDIQDKINETNSEMAGVHSKMTQALEEVNRLNSEIAACETKISEHELEIQSLTTQIGEKQKNIEEQQKRYDEQQLILDRRLVAVYESGNTTYLDVLLSSTSITDFISKYYLLETLTESDAELLTEIQNLKTQIQTEKTALENNKTQVETEKKSIEIEKKSVENLLRDKKIVVANLNAEEKALQTELDEFEEDKREIQKEIARISAENAKKAQEAAKAAQSIQNSKPSSSTTSSSTTTSNSSSSSSPSVPQSSAPKAPSSSGFICPIAGRSKSDITTGFYGYRNHNGVDFARNSKGQVNGLPVLAAKSGTVSISKALKRANGSYKSYGEYIVINHGDGTMTLYAHMQPGSRRVEKGQWVNQGQQIGNVGTTGNSSGPHLHFEVRSASGGYLNPSNYLP